MAIQRHFLDWTLPALHQAARFLLDLAPPAKPIDLADTLIVVPTRQAGRRLREALAVAASRRGTGVLLGRLITPEALLESTASDKPIADPVVELAVWLSVLQGLDDRDVEALFPGGLSVADSTVLLDLSRELVGLRRLLGEEGLLIEDVCRRWPEIPEEPRWRVLETLEETYRCALGKMGWSDPEDVKREVSRAPVIPAGCRRICALFLPDPIPLALQALEKISETVPVDICIHAPATLADHFDTWGRPVPEKWEERRLTFAGVSMELYDTAEVEAEAVAAEIGSSDTPGRFKSFALGVPDPSRVPLLTMAMREKGITLFDPAGHPLNRTALYALVNRLRTLLEDNTYTALSAFLRHPDCLESLRRICPDFSAGSCLTALDDLQNRHLPSTASRVFELRKSLKEERTPDLILALDTACSLRDEIKRAGVLKGLPLTLSRLYAGMTADDLFGEAATGLHETLHKLEPVSRIAKLSEEAVWELLMNSWGGQRFYADRRRDDIEALGWLELPWEDAPLLWLTGLNEGIVPESVPAHLFLPDSARRNLTLRDNRFRFGRDIYLLESLLLSRKDGAVHLSLSRYDRQGDPAKPSRLLFQCGDDAFLEQTRRLFSEKSPRRSPGAAAKSSPWPFSPPPVREGMPLPPGGKISVTQFKAYLECPFRFYLNHVCGLQPLDDGMAEMDGALFGTILHSILRTMGDKDEWRDCTDPGALAGFLQSELDRKMKAEFGKDLTVALRIQQYSLRQRLQAVAHLQAEERRNGWRIEQVELTLESRWEDVTVRAKVDRIDRHETTGAWRIIDYKTGENDKDPRQSHLAKGEGDSSQAYALVDHNGVQYRWKDLQLPLYHRLWREKHPSGDILCAYLTIPKATTETQIVPWDDLSETLVGRAENCARTILRRVSGGIFWPPAPKVKHETWEPLLTNAYGARIEAGALETRRAGWREA